MWKKRERISQSLKYHFQKIFAMKCIKIGVFVYSIFWKRLIIFLKIVFFFKVYRNLSILSWAEVTKSRWSMIKCVADSPIPPSAGPLRQPNTKHQHIRIPASASSCMSWIWLETDLKVFATKIIGSVGKPRVSCSNLPGWVQNLSNELPTPSGNRNESRQLE